MKTGSRKFEEENARNEEFYRNFKILREAGDKRSGEKDAVIDMAKLAKRDAFLQCARLLATNLDKKSISDMIKEYASKPLL